MPRIASRSGRPSTVYQRVQRWEPHPMTGSDAASPGPASGRRPAGALPGAFTGLGRRRFLAGGVPLVTGRLALVLVGGEGRRLDHPVPLLLGPALVVAARLLGVGPVALPAA